MFRSLVLVILSLCLSACAFGQGTVRGTVSDQSGETIIGAVVKVKEHPTVSAMTDLDGKFSLKIPDASPATITVSFMSLKSLEKQVTVRNNDVLVVDVTLEEDKKDLGDVVVERKAKRTSDTHLERMKLNSAANIDYISGEAMLKTGDGDASAAVKRVTGVSTAGAFVTVRGLADRYIVTTINGSRVPTLDPLTNNLRLDIFPTGLLDNIVITKTATPESPGDWSGASISLNTSDYPEKLRVSVTSSFGYNPNSSFQTIVGAGRSSTDWLGHDDGLRDVPGGVPIDVEQFPTFIDPNVYQQLSILGQGPTMAGYGITSATQGFGGAQQMSGQSLQNLMLTELGLLAPALINDPEATAAAAAAYNSTYDLAYFSPILNGSLASLNTRFNNSNWRVTEQQGSPNFNQSVSIGNQIDLFKKSTKPKTLGFLLGFRYATETEYDGSSTLERNGLDRSAENPAPFYDYKSDQRISTESNGWNALGSVSLQLSRNHSVSLLLMPNVLGQNNARYQRFLKPGVSGETFVSEDQFYEERRLWVYQFGSKHFFPGLRLRMEADVSYSDGSRNILDLKTVQYILVAGGDLSQTDGALTKPSRIYRFLDETMLDARLSFELPLSKDERKTGKVKFGGGFREDERLNTQTFFAIVRAPGPLDWEDPGRFDMQPDGTFATLYTPFGTFRDNDIGISRVTSGHVLLDLPLSTRLRAVGGVRAEHTDMISDIQRFYEQGLASDDPARGFVGTTAIAGASGTEPKPAVAGLLFRWDLLPSINLIQKLGKKEDAPMNLRIGYFRSLARPSFREFSVVQLFDYQLNATVYGNPDLEITTIDNYDVRLERFFANRNNVSVSGFYKDFKNHIEMLSTSEGGFTWRNADRSRVIGAELEGRIGLTRKLEWRGNITAMYSESDITITRGDREVKYSSPMFGQAPYIVNSMVTYTLDSARFSTSVSYNVQGPRLAVTNSIDNPTQVQAYEMPRHMIDVTVSKALGKHWGLRARVRNLLNAPQLRQYKFDSGYDVDFDRYRFGTEYQLSVSYTIK